MIILEEIWKPVEGYTNRYEVSNKGRVRSLEHVDSLGRFHKSVVLKQNFDGKGNYLHVMLCGSPKNVHRLVATAFIPNPSHLPEVNHKDEDKTNNVCSNLEWCTRLYNNTYGSKRDSKKGTKHHGCKLTELEVREIRKLINAGGKQADIAVKFNVSKSQVSAICTGRYWGWLK